jgi:glycosyltransferase involved in cell wall biosynthesis
LHLLYVFPEPLPLPRARGVQVAHFLRALAQVGVRITLAYVASGQEHPFSPIGQSVPENVSLLPLSRGLGWPLGRTGIKSHRLFMWRLGRWIRQAIKAGNVPDIVFFRHVKAAAHFAQAFPDLPFIYEAHEVFAETAKPSQRKRLRALEQIVLTRAHLVLANSHGSAQGALRAHGLDRTILVLPNGVDYPASVPDKPWAECHRHIIYAGSLFGWKGVDDLVDAMAFLDGYQVTIVGGSAEQIERLRDRQPSAGGELVFTGQLPQFEVQKLLANACIAVLPNRPDPDSQFTSPLKLFEYMASGCAVVATDLPSVREVLGEDDAAWATPGDPQALAGAIRSLCQASGRASALGAAARLLVRQRTWQERAMKLLAALSETGEPFRAKLTPIFGPGGESAVCDA